MDHIEARIKFIQDKIRSAEKRYHRNPGSVKLLLVSKGQSIEKIQQAITAGQHNFGENYLQEALGKMAHLVTESLTWHFIGAIQSNKTQGIVDHFSWVHSLTRVKIAQRLDEQLPSFKPRLNVCLEVNVDNDPAKEGVNLEELPALAFEISRLPRLHLRGLMAIPTQSDSFEQQRKPFRILREAFDQLNASGLMLDTLSMGMSDDFEAAIAEGATVIRIGTAVFGERSKRN